MLLPAYKPAGIQPLFLPSASGHLLLPEGLKLLLAMAGLVDTAQPKNSRQKYITKLKVPFFFLNRKARIKSRDLSKTNNKKFLNG